MPAGMTLKTPSGMHHACATCAYRYAYRPRYGVGAHATHDLRQPRRCSLSTGNRMAYQSIRKVTPRQSGRAAPSPARTEDGLDITRTHCAHAMAPCPNTDGTSMPYPVVAHGLSARAARGGLLSDFSHGFFNHAFVRSPALPAATTRAQPGCRSVTHRSAPIYEQTHADRHDPRGRNPRGRDGW